MERISMMVGSNRAIVGEPAPRFNCRAIIDGRIKDISLQSIMANKQWLMLTFFPMAWSFICPTEILAFNARLAEFSSRGCAVVFASTDSEHVLKAWNALEKEEGGLGGAHIPLMSDRSHRLCRDYGVLIEEEGIAQRATFIIDPIGIIRSTIINDTNVGRSVEEAKRMIDALQFTDEFGDGCPVDWKAGQRGIKMGSREPIHPHQESIPAASTPTSPRPGVSRGMSWTPGWVKSPKILKLPETPTEGYFGGRPRSMLWANDEAVGSNGEISAS